MNDLRYALRLFRKTPISSAAAVATLALGIGANLAVFSLIDRVILHPLAVPDPKSLVLVQETYPSADVPIVRTGFLYDDYRRVRDSSTTLAAVAAFGTTAALTTSYGSGAVPARAMFVSANFFEAVGLPPVAGRAFRADEDVPGAAPVAIVSSRVWQTRFARDPNVVGRTIRVSGAAVTVVGVAPPSLPAAQLGPNPPELFLPIESARRLIVAPGNYFSSATTGGFSPNSWLSIVGRLGPGVTVAQASAEVDGLFPDVKRKRPRTVAPLEQNAVPMRADNVRFAVLLGAAVALTLLIGCANLTSLLLARVEERQTELAVRAAIGGSHWRLARQLLVEAVVVAAAGGIAALIVAAWIDSALASFELPGRVAIAALRPALDGRLIGAAVALTVVAALLCGLAPALAGVRGDLLSVMRRETTASPRMRTARTLVAVQVAICLVLVFGCSLFVRAVSSAMAIDVGFDPHHLIVVASNPWSNGYDTGRSRRYLSALLDRVRTLPGVVAAASGTPPLTNALSMATPVVRIDGTQVGPTSVAMSATAPAMVYVSVVSGDYFSTIGQRLAAGRDFGGADSAASEPVAIVSESAARRFWPGQNPVGRHIGFQPLTADATVVGIARDVRYANLLDDQRACVYLPVAQAPGGLGLNAPIVIRTASAFSSADVYRAAADIDSSLPVADLRSVDEYMARLLMPQRLGTSLLGLLGAVALAVTIVGVYGLIACGVARSRREVGIRMALGADRRDILGHTCARAVVPVAIGVVAGCAASLWAGRFADRFMYGIRGTDPTSLIAAAVLLLTAAGVAALLPAMRATRIDPVEALRAD